MHAPLNHNEDLIETLLSGGVAVIRTDTLYGLVARADDESAVARVYAIKHRNPSKSCIILVDSPASIYGSADGRASVLSPMPTLPVSYLIDGSGAPPWLLRQNRELAYRIPTVSEVRDLLTITGPLIAPSANPEGQPPARTIDEAKNYFGDLVDIYVDGGTVSDATEASKLIRLHPDGTQERLR